MKILIKKTVPVVLIASLVPALFGCCEEHRNDGGKPLRLGPIYGSAITGAIIGGIVGHQSDEPGEGAAVGAALFGVGALLGEIDRQHEKGEHKHEEECAEEVVIQIRNDNGSTMPIVLKKKGGTYIGPNGEHYKELPTEEQLKPIYGL
jgi:hypothetical protein